MTHIRPATRNFLSKVLVLVTALTLPMMAQGQALTSPPEDTPEAPAQQVAVDPGVSDTDIRTRLENILSATG